MEIVPRVQTRARCFTSGSRDLPSLPLAPQLKPSTSIPELATVRRQLASSQYRPDRGPNARYTNSSLRRDAQTPWDEVRASYRSALTNGSYVQDGEVRSSVRSAWTNGSAMTFASSSILDASEAERSSVLTRDSSFSDNFNRKGQIATSDEGMSVEDAISLYMHGFGDDDDENKIPDGMDDIRQLMPSPLMEEPEVSIRHEESFNGSNQTYEGYYPRDVHKSPSLPELPLSPPAESTEPSQSSSAVKELPRKEAALPSPPLSTQASSPPRPIEVEHFVAAPRDRYGFRKASQHITVEQYDSWNGSYTEYLERRRKKWHLLMKHHGLSTENPNRFPPRSDKVKRYIRKGIPHEWRGAAWFWYAGGPAKLVQESGRYWHLVEQANKGILSESDRDHIERDLNRTFPDNIRFKPDPTSPIHHPHWNDTITHPHRTKDSLDPRTTDPSIVRALRRVLQAFALHNPTIGYCQSLNFIAGLLLLFLNEDEEKAFILLDIITTQHLPGTHAKILEANVDIAVLMMSIREALPAVWGKIDDGVGTGAGTTTGLSVNRLPTVSLATTAWFMALFVGSLPIETVVRVWDSLFYEGSKTLFRIALAVFKLGEGEIRAVGEQLEVFQVVQAIPRKMLDVNALMEACFKRRGGCGFLSQEVIDRRRAERRRALQKQREMPEGLTVPVHMEEEMEGGGRGRVGAGLRRAASRARFRARV